MSKPTHILVPIEAYESLANNQFGDIYEDFAEYPKVDLSEEGIGKQAVIALRREDETGNRPSISSYITGYNQCAKDLLNTK